MDITLYFLLYSDCSSTHNCSWILKFYFLIPANCTREVGRKKMNLSWLNYLFLLLKWVWRLIECIWFLGSSFSPSPPLNSSWLFHPYHPASNNKFTFFFFFQVGKLKTDIWAGLAICVTLYKIGSIFFLWWKLLVPSIFCILIL